MKRALGRWCLPTELTSAEVIDLAVEAGFDGIEWALFEHGEISLDSSEAELTQLSAMCSSRGLAVSSVATGLLWKYSLTHDDPEVAEEGKRIVKKLIDTAAILGAPSVLVVPGAVDAVIGYDMAWARALDAVKTLSIYAATKRVIIGIENVWNRFLLSPREMRSFIDEVGSGWVGCYFDAGNVMQYGIPQDWVKALGSRICAVHIKGFKLNPGGYAGFVGLMEGDNDWPALVRALDEVGYDGFIIPEVPPLPEGPEATARLLASQLREIIGAYSR